MKTIYYLILALAAGLLTTSCSNQYEGAIHDYILSKHEANTDIGLDIKEVKEIRSVSVADSVAFLTKINELALNSNIAEIEGNIAKYQQIIVSGIDGQKLSDTLKEAYVSEINRSKVAIDSLKAMPAKPITLYEGRKADDVLAVVVSATYEIKNPEKESITKDFLLSKDGAICFSTTENPDMDPAK